MDLGHEQMHQAAARPALSAHRVESRKSNTGEQNLELTISNIFFSLSLQLKNQGTISVLVFTSCLVVNELFLLTNLGLFHPKTPFIFLW